MFEVVSEFSPNAKFKGFLVGNIKNPKTGATEMLSLNKSSYASIAEAFGKDTKEWIGKTIQYDGIHKFGAMNGKLFIAVIPF